MAKQPTTGNDFVRLAEKSDRVQRIRQGKGSHVVIEFIDGTSVTVPIHANRQLGKGLLSKLRKAFQEAGLL